MAVPYRYSEQMNAVPNRYETDDECYAKVIPIVSHLDEVMKQARDLSVYAHNLVEALQGIGSLSESNPTPERSGVGGQISEVQIAVQNAHASLRELRIYLIGGE